MIRLSALFWLVLVSATGFAMFGVKYEVQALADQFAQTTKRADDSERDLRVLDAEWAYLNRPNALAQMNQRYLSLVPIATKQLVAGVTELPMRPVPLPSTETVAATAEISPPQSATPSHPVGQSAEAQPPARQPSAPSRPADNGGPVVTAALETQVANSELARPVFVKAVARPSPVRRAKSLDELIAQIAASR
jgi:cell division protein FtsL